MAGPGIVYNAPNPMNGGYTPVYGSQNPDGSFNMNEVTVTANGGGSSSSGGNAWMSLINGDNLGGIAKIISSLKGDGSTTYVSPPASPGSGGNNTLWIILGLGLAALLLWFLFKK